jgi:hypothetical protein
MTFYTWLTSLFCIYFTEFIDILQLNNSNTFLLEPFWYNDKIKVQNNTIFNNKLYDKGFHIISDLLDGDGEFLKLEQIYNKH